MIECLSESGSNMGMWLFFSSGRVPADLGDEPELRHHSVGVCAGHPARMHRGVLLHGLAWPLPLPQPPQPATRPQPLRSRSTDHHYPSLPKWVFTPAPIHYRLRQHSNFRIFINVPSSKFRNEIADSTILSFKKVSSMLQWRFYNRKCHSNHPCGWISFHSL